MRSWLFTVILTTYTACCCSGCSNNQTLTAEQANDSAKNLSTICKAVLNSEAKVKTLPTRYLKTKDGKPGLSWRVAILPELGEQSLYSQFQLDEPWDSDRNKPLLTKMPSVYKSPVAHAPEGFTNYLAISTPTSAWGDEKPTTMRQIADGTMNTISALEVDDAHAVEWTKPTD